MGECDMFPHSITIYKHSIIDGEDVYFMQCVDGFYWQEKTNLNNKDKGSENTGEITVISSLRNAQSFNDKWNVDIGDIIIKGKGNHITSLKEPDTYYKVNAVSFNVCGSLVDNIVVNAK